METGLVVWALAAAFGAVVLCNVTILAGVQKLIAQVQKSSRERDEQTVRQSLEYLEHMRDTFTEEVVQARIAAKGLEHFSVDAHKRTLAAIAGVMEALDLNEEEAKAYLRSQIPEPSVRNPNENTGTA